MPIRKRLIDDGSVFTSKRKADAMAKSNIKITVKGADQGEVSTIIRMIENATKKGGLLTTIDDANGERMIQHHMDNGMYSQNVVAMRNRNVSVTLVSKERKPKAAKSPPKSPPPSDFR